MASLYAFQRPFREYPGREYENFPIPPDWQEKTEWAFARLMYPTMPGVHGRGRYGRGYGRFGGGDPWTQGYTSWTTDYPRSDRHFSAALRRLTRIHARSVEQPVNLDEGDQYDWPWLYAVEVGHWNLTRGAGKIDARISAARRLLHVRRFPRHRRVGRLHRQHAAGVPGPADCGYRKQGPDLSHHLRSGRPLPGARRAVCAQRPHLRVRRLRARTGAASTTTRGG